MKYNEHTQLEACVERHRADFDLHEPRPELWAALEKQLQAAPAAGSPPAMSVAVADATASGQRLSFTLPAEAAALSKPRAVWAERYSLAAALAVLLLAAGLGEAWKSNQPVGVRGSSSAVATAPASPSVADAALYLAQPGERAASSVSQPSNARLDTAVRGMEMYYVSQLADRKAELSQLAPAAAAECSRELVELDSSYQQLKRVLPQHPQPEVVLTAMNRNLQFRLDILDQQLEVHGPAQTALNSEVRGEFALADSRQLAETTPRHDR